MAVCYNIAMDNFPVPFPTRLHPSVHYPVGTVVPWYAADCKADVKDAKANLPEGWELASPNKVTLKPNRPNNYPHFFNGSNHPIYVLYIRKVA